LRLLIAARLSQLPQGATDGGLRTIYLQATESLPVRLRVAYTGTKGRRVNFTRDLNEEGAFVRCAEMLEIGASTMLLISPPGGDYRPVEVAATVTRQHAQGNDRGVGVKFDFRDDQERAELSAAARNRAPFRHQHVG